MSARTTVKSLAKYLVLVVLALLLVLAAAIPLARWETPDDLIPVDRRQALAIDNVHLLTMETDQPLMGRQLLIRDGLIEDIRASGTPVGADYRVIDAAGAYLMPGLFDMHVHAMDRKYLALSLAYGVTSVRNMGGYPMHLRWKQELARDEWLGSNLFTATPTLNGKKNSNPLGVEHRLSSIAAGKVADLVMTRHNPSTRPVTLSSPLAVVKGGQWLGESDLERLKQSAENPSNVYFTLGRLLEFMILG